ncbi:MAG: DUF6364 family protein [Cyclobacteriaceae bacterium]|jgi:hypothetical protein|nr:type II toxin-antitoxin system CcdA family antitoxin [Flammeovirgaceae bacterium]
MKVRINLTIENELLSKAKRYAASKKISVSELFEDYLNKVVQPSKRKTVLEVLEKLEAPHFDSKKDLKREFYQEKAKKYGF